MSKKFYHPGDIDPDKERFLPLISKLIEMINGLKENEWGHAFKIEEEEAKMGFIVADGKSANDLMNFGLKFAEESMDSKLHTPVEDVVTPPSKVDDWTHNPPRN